MTHGTGEPGTGGPPEEGGAPGAWAAAPAPPDPAPPGRTGSIVAVAGVGALLLALALVAVLVVVPRVFGGDDADPDAFEGSSWMRSTDPGPIDEPADDPRWKVRLGSECGYACSLAADSLRVYVATVTSESGGSIESEVMAYDATSGDEAWDRPLTGDSVVSLRLTGHGLAVDGTTETILVDPASGRERWSADGSLSSVVGDVGILLGGGEETTTVAVDMASGDELWDLDGYVTDCGTALLHVASNRLTRLDPRSGDDVWTARTPQPDGPHAGFACNDRIVARATDTDELTVLSLSDGKEIGTIDVPGRGDVSPSARVSGETVILLGNGEILAFRPRGGDYEEVWDVRGPQYAQSFTSRGAFIYVSPGDEAAVLDVDDGSVIGRTRLSNGDRSYFTAASLLLADESRIEAFDLQTLDDRWSLRVRDVTTMTVGGYRLFVISDDELQAYG